ncbi:GGDEF domain-containing protein [Candidatus Absconditicoccus praedator]|uniref:GGDEF domain-containing protein n=1 Tax=Candidatus Absconditicoccus praedator TaxID=2735562 RepID=UPI001E2D8557|nr:GGDEF domain-containing protein [Candidatus Absconditicoccus praedator]UFX82899.1 GGDEF domain-containing protein [Candidatus Absconditicoccus praedator]
MNLPESFSCKGVMKELKNHGIEKQQRKQIMKALDSYRRKSILVEEKKLKEKYSEIIQIQESFMDEFEKIFQEQECYELLNFFEILMNFFNNKFSTMELEVYEVTENINGINNLRFCKPRKTSHKKQDKTTDEISYLEEKALNSENKELIYKITDISKKQEDIAGIKIQTNYKETFLITIILSENLNSSNYQTFLEEFVSLKNIFEVSRLSFLLEEKIAALNSSFKDRLTGLFNKAYLDTKLDETGWSAIYIDIDSFKELNDTYGHCVGDYALQLLSKALKESVRYEDKTCRLYGDEFMILVNTYNGEEVKKILERIRQKVNGISFETENKKNKQIETVDLSASLGIAIGDNKKTVKELLKESDALMLGSKTTSGSLYRLRQQLESCKESDREEVVENLLDVISYKQLVRILAKKILQKE